MRRADLSKNMNKKIIFYVLLPLAVIMIVSSIIFNIITERTKYRLVAGNTNNNQTVSLVHTISFAFNKNINQKFEDSCNAALNPLDTDTSINSQGNELFIRPNRALAPNQVYGLTLICSDDVNLVLNFKTSGGEELTQEEIGIIQSQKDYETAQVFENLYKAEPWQKEIPYEKELYELAYSQEENKYYVYLKLPPGSTIDRNELQNIVHQDLQKINAPILDIVWR